MVLTFQNVLELPLCLFLFHLFKKKYSALIIRNICNQPEEEIGDRNIGHFYVTVNYSASGTTQEKRV